MGNTVAVLQWINVAAYTAVGALAVANWIRHRDRRHGALALALGGLAVVALAGRAGMALESRGLSSFAVVAFLASGWGLLSFRNAVLPLARRVRMLAAAALAVSGTAVVALGPPQGAVADLTWAHHLVIGALVLAWSGCVVEPAIRFWRAAAGRTLVQRRRLRALSLGNLGIVAILVIAVTVPLGTGPSPLRLVLQSGSLLLVPLLYASLAPPAWLRRRWRAREEHALRMAIRDVFRGADEAGIGRAGLDQALRLLGAETGFASAEDRFLITSDMPVAEARLLATMLAPPCIAPAPGPEGSHIVAAPLGAGGIVAVASGPFSPVFGQDELETLRDLAASMDAALERVALTRALRDESQRYEALLHTISDLGVGVAIADGERLVYANEGLCEITGFRRIELLAMPSFLDLISPEARATVADHHTRLLDEDAGNTADGDGWEAPIVRPDGTIRWIGAASKLLYMNGRRYVLAIVRDVTERITAAEWDRRRAAQLATLAESCQRLAGSSDLEAFFPALATSAARVSRAGRALVATILPGTRVRWFSEEGPVEDPPEATGIIDVIITEGRVVRSSRTVGSLGRPGAVHEVLGVPVARGDRLLGAILMMGPDDRFDEIDENVAVSLATYAAEAIETARAFERERAMTRRLRELDQAKNAFLAAVSHELRTPLTSVIGFAQTLRRSGGMLPEDQQRLLVDRLTANAEKLQGLLADLLDIDRLNRGIIEPVRRPTDVGALTIRAVENFEFTVPRPIHLDIAPVQADVDGSKVERIVENLLANAQRHTTADTPIWVRVRHEDGGVALIVEDAGPGVPAEARDRIFEPFQQGPSRNHHAPGVGIGLSLVGRFAELHGGRAWVEDRPGGGASFRVWLPIRDPRIATPERADALA